MSPTDSSSRSSRSPKPDPKSSPNASCSGSNQPPPRPRTNRPPDRWSTVVASFAVSPGGRKVLAPTSRPRRTRRVTVASAEIVAQPSSLGSDRVALVGQQVIVDPQRVPAGALGGEARVAQLRPRRSLDPERRAEAHRSPQARVAYRRSVSGPPDFPPALRDAILDWYVSRARSLPFRGSTDPYAILVSEAMAQQTQAARAGDAWTRFMDRFPTVEALAAATPADVLRAWQGLGYNRRALNLWRAANRIVDEFGGRVPTDLADLETLPGSRAVYRAGRRGAGVRDAGRRGRHERAPRPWPDRRGRRRALEPRRDAAPGGRGGAGGSGGRLDPCRDGRRRDPVPAAFAGLRSMPGTAVVSIRRRRAGADDAARSPARGLPESAPLRSRPPRAGSAVASWTVSVRPAMANGSCFDVLDRGHMTPKRCSAP